MTRAADVVLPVAPVTDKAGTFVTWEGRPRPFEAVLHNPGSLPDLRVLSGIADELDALGHGSPLGFRTVAEVRAEMTEMGPWDGDRPAALRPVAAATPRLRDAARDLEAAARQRPAPGRRPRPARHRPPRASPRVPAARASEYGEAVTITGDRGSVTLPAVATDDLTDDTVWIPANSFGRGVLADLASPGSTVTVTRGAL